MNADTKNNILSILVEAQQLDLERSRMLLEDQRMQIIEKTAQVLEEVSYMYSHFYLNKDRSNSDRMLYEAACDALDLLDPEHAESRD